MAVASSEAVAAERRLTGRRSNPPFSWDRLTPFLLVAPSIVLIAVFVYGFIGYTGFTSTTRWSGVVPDYTSVGLKQYQLLFDLPRFQADVSNTIRFTLMFLAASILLGFGALTLEAIEEGVKELGRALEEARSAAVHRG